MTYLLNGKQYIAVAISGVGFGGELIASACPGRSRVQLSALRAGPVASPIG